MSILLLLLAQMTMSQTEAPRIDASEGTDTLVELPAHTTHHNNITTEMLAASTIAYCERNSLTRCENSVSGLSGGTSVVVCKVGTQWLINSCSKP